MTFYVRPVPSLAASAFRSTPFPALIPAFALALSLGLSAQAARAEGRTANRKPASSIRVIKTSGTRAIVEFESEPGAEAASPPEPGQAFAIEPLSESGSSQAAAQAGTAPSAGASASSARDSGGAERSKPRGLSRTVGGSFELSNLRDSSSELNEKRVAFAGRFGWNWGRWEAGPILSVSNVDQESSAAFTIEAGGFVDVNFAPNDGRGVVWGLGASARAGRVNRARVRASFSNSLASFETGPFAKGFLAGSSACVRADLLYSSSTSSGDVPYETTASGVKALAGLQVYF